MVWVKIHTKPLNDQHLCQIREIKNLIIQVYPYVTYVSAQQPLRAYCLYTEIQ